MEEGATESLVEEDGGGVREEEEAVGEEKWPD